MQFGKQLTMGALALLCALTFVTVEAQAQRSGPPSSRQPSGPELSATYGSIWGGNLDTQFGKLRTATGESWGIALDVPAAHGVTVELSYTRQEGALNLDNQGITPLTDMTVEYWQIGSLQSLRPGPVSPFLVGGLGATHFSPEEGSFFVDGEEYFLQSTTRFSLHFGAGLKAYFGQAQKIGLRASFKVMPTIYDSAAGIWFGSGGASVSVGGYAIWQFEAAAGLTVRFGG